MEGQQGLALLRVREVPLSNPAASSAGWAGALVPAATTLLPLAGRRFPPDPRARPNDEVRAKNPGGDTQAPDNINEPFGEIETLHIEGTERRLHCDRRGWSRSRETAGRLSCQNFDQRSSSRSLQSSWSGSAPS